jgi:hypothetical protein
MSFSFVTLTLKLQAMKLTANNAANGMGRTTLNLTFRPRTYRSFDGIQRRAFSAKTNFGSVL